MVKTETIIAVRDVEKSSDWYQQLLGCRSSHGGDTFEILADKDDGTVILCLHKWGEHEHPTLSDAKIPSGNGLILYFRVSDLDEIWDNARRIGAHIEYPPQLNTNSGQMEFAIRDLDNYYLLISL